ncbi:MAG: RNA-binding protein [Thaumarchaeota archaeon]|nr:RNA-binding protein [Nitrososphaerota archaeon]
MSFERVLKVPSERVGVLIGKGGETKKNLEKLCGVELAIDGKSGEIIVKTSAIDDSDPLRAVNIIEAVGRGFSPQRAIKLMESDTVLEIMDLRDYGGKSENALERIRGRIIGLHGKSRRVIEELTGCYVSVFGRTVAVIGNMTDAKLAKDAITMLAEGSAHKSVYQMLQRERTKRKMEKLLLWEDQSPETGEVR